VADKPRDRLRDLQSLLKAGGGIIKRGRDLEGAKEEKRQSQTQWADSLGGQERTTDEGACLFFEHRFPFTSTWGDWPVSSLGELSSQDVETLLPRGSGDAVHPHSIAFIDAETTGLAGGTGTYAFLIAIGNIEDDAFVVRQYFMRDFSEEAAQLELVEEDISRFKALGSFNGKSFDVPLLASRFITHRRRLRAQSWPHVDMLHPSRRIWRARLSACNLQNLETHIFGYRRVGDIPGEMIPRVYFNFIRGRRLSDMTPVIEHNARDVLSTALLLAAVARIRRNPAELTNHLDQWSVARWLLADGSEEEAAEAFESLLKRGGLGHDVWWESCRSLSLICKRRGMWERALCVWETMAKQTEVLDQFPYIEQAKHSEHQQRNPQEALRLVDELLNQINLAEQFNPELGSWDIEDIMHRRKRLLRKCES
jgi:uncharacterized protein